MVRYSHDADGDVTLKTDARGEWVTYNYDALNRVTNKSYSDPATLPVTLTYDSPSILNGIYRLASETELNGSQIVYQRLPAQYDPMGRLKMMSECSLASCSTSPYQVSYNYDFLGNITTSTDGIPSSTFNQVAVPDIAFTMTYDGASRLSNVASSWSDAFHPSTLFQAASTAANAPAYSPAGGLMNAVLGINTQTSVSTATLARAYDDRLRVLSETDTATSMLMPAEASTGNISISGTELTGGGTPGSASITITGSEGTHLVCTTTFTYNGKIQVPVTTCHSVTDTGSLTVTVNGFPATATYGTGSSDPSVASALAAALSGPGSPVQANSPAGSNVVTMTSFATGPAGNYPFSITNGADFTGQDSGTTMTGGTAGPSDTGIITVSINGVASAPISWGASSTPQSLASAIASAVASSTLQAIPSASSVHLTSLQSGTAGNVPVSCSVTHTSTQFASASFVFGCSGMSGGANAATGPGVAYSYSIPFPGGYAVNGNLLSVADSVSGGWSYGYDTLNRLTSATGVSGNFNGQFSVAGATLGWTIDPFGNRTAQTASSPNLPSAWATVSTTNQATASSAAPGGVHYDGEGGVTFDGVNQYAYDGEGRVCAVGSGYLYTQYIYDVDGNRVAKGLVNSLSCNLATNGFALTKSYVYGAGGELLTEMDANGAWDHSNVYADGKLLGTYHDTNTYFAFSDWLGTKRAELSAAGC